MLARREMLWGVSSPGWTAFITRNGAQSVVMLSLEDFQALEETAGLLRNPANAQRLLSATAQLNAGHGTERRLAECA